MAIRYPDFQPMNLEQAAPFGKAYQQMAEAQLSQMQRAKIGEELPYVGKQAEADLFKTQLANEWYPKIQQSEIGLRGAQAQEASALAGLHGTEAQQKALILKWTRKKLEAAGIPSAGQMSEGTGFYGSPTIAAPTTINVEGGTSAQTRPTSMQPQEPSSTEIPVGRTNTSMYGIPNQSPTADDVMNKLAFGADTFTPRNENTIKQQQDQYKGFQDIISSSSQASIAAKSADQALDVFNNAMDRATYRGSKLGGFPSTGLVTVGQNMSPEQEADRAALKMLPAAITELKTAMGQANFSNLDMRQSQQMKFDRTMDDETRRLNTAWTKAVHQRLDEQPKFYSMIGNPASGATKADADLLWKEYQNQFPIIGTDEKGRESIKYTNLNKWLFFATPKAIDSIKKTGSYKPSAAEMKNTWMQLPATQDHPNGRVVLIKPKFVNEATKHGARSL
jgi:hypothetical protein